MNINILSFCIVFAAAMGVAVVIYRLVRDSLTALLNEVIKMSSGTTFYVRVFGICL